MLYTSKQNSSLHKHVVLNRLETETVEYLPRKQSIKDLSLYTCIFNLNLF
jgi:hypothetical protein